MGYVWLASALWMGLALLASILAIWTGISVSLLEVFLGGAAANTIGLAAAPWVDYLAGLGAIMLAFLAGTEVRMAVIREYAFASVAIGASAFFAPFLSVLLFALFLMGWNLPQALIGAIALSTTSVALVYAVIAENGMSDTRAGQIILAARFVNDLCTVLSLGLVATNFDYRLALFGIAMGVALLAIPRVMPWFIEKAQNRLSEPDVRLVGVMLFLLGGLASISGAEAVIPSYLLGVALASTLRSYTDLGHRLKTVTFAWFAPFYFLRAGSFVDLSQWHSIIVLAATLTAIKIASKCMAIIWLAGALRIEPRDRWPIALLMSTGLTFGTITAFLGWTHGIIDRHQYSLLVMAVIASGTIPVLLLNRIRRRAS